VIRTARRAMAVAAALTAAGLALTAPAASAVSNSTPSTVTPTVTWSPVPGGHFCQSTGFDAHGQQGVACNNFYQGFDSGIRVVTSEIELKCGNSSGLLPCTSALAVGNLQGGPSYTARCVPSGPVCPTAGYKVRSPFGKPIGECQTVSATVNATQGTGGFTLPDGVQKTTPAPLTSTVRVCP
jgi:hypothetical protein